MSQSSMKTADPLAALEEKVRRQRLEEIGAKAVSDAVSRLVLGKDAAHCFFATNALKIAGSGNAVPDWRIQTACTDGKIMRSIA